MKKLELFHLISIINEKGSDEICIEARSLNRLHQELLKHNIRSDFSKSTLQRIEYDYPNHVVLKNTGVIVHKVSSLGNSGYYNANSFDSYFNQVVEEQWKRIQKEF